MSKNVGSYATTISTNAAQATRTRTNASSFDFILKLEGTSHAAGVSTLVCRSGRLSSNEWIGDATRLVLSHHSSAFPPSHPPLGPGGQHSGKSGWAAAAAFTVVMPVLTTVVVRNWARPCVRCDQWSALSSGRAVPSLRSCTYAGRTV